MVPKAYFDPPWKRADWERLAVEMLRLLPEGSASAFTMARLKRGLFYEKMYEQFGMYATCPPVVQEAMFYERRDVQDLLELGLAFFHSVMTPQEFDDLVTALTGTPWHLELKDQLYNDVKAVISEAEIACVPGTTIQFWNGLGLGVLPSELYVIFIVLLFGEKFDYIHTFSLTSEGALENALRTAWRLNTTLTTTPPRSGTSISPG